MPRRDCGDELFGFPGMFNSGTSGSIGFMNSGGGFDTMQSGFFGF